MRRRENCSLFATGALVYGGVSGLDPGKSSLKDTSKSFIAVEGVPFLLAFAAITAAVWYASGPLYALIPFAALVFCCLIFRDPRRGVVAEPLGVVSPVDGKVVEVGITEQGLLADKAHKIVIRVNCFGTYTARCPVEGKVMDLNCELDSGSFASETNALWLKSDEDDDIVLQFYGYRFGIVPRAIVDYGERVGQGHRCAYLRLTRFAELQLPVAARVLVTEGQRVRAGTFVLAELQHPEDSV